MGDQPAPVTFRPRNEQARTVLEAVAEHRHVSLSKVVSDATEIYIRQYVDLVGPDKFAQDIQEARARKDRSLIRQVDDFIVAVAGEADALVEAGEVEETPPSTRTKQAAGTGK